MISKQRAEPAPRQHAIFGAHVEAFSNVTSRMMRRASLVLCYHVIRRATAGLPLPNLYRMTDTYWKAWLCIGLKDAAKVPLPKARFRPGGSGLG